MNPAVAYLEAQFDRSWSEQQQKRADIQPQLDAYYAHLERIRERERTERLERQLREALTVRAEQVMAE